MRRAVGIIRVSRVGGREGESFASPEEQTQRIRAACERDGLQLVETVEELDVSGGTPLTQREGLRGAVEAIEAGQAEVVMVAYFDRLVRSLSVQEEVVSRVEAAGGSVMAVDVGAVSGSSAGQWLTGTFLGAVAEYQRRSTRERAGAAQARAVARGVAPWPRIPLGYVREDDGTLAPSERAPLVEEVFAMRASGSTIREVRAHLAGAGVSRSYHGVQQMLRSRIYLGEIAFGKLVNPEAHPAIVSRDLWAAAQRTRVTRGARAKSDRLLARLGVLRCGTCDARMVIGVKVRGEERYPFYRCSPTGDCPKRATISADIAERVVVEAVREALADEEGRASAERSAREADAAHERAQADLDAAVRAFAGLEDERAAIERLAELREVRDSARDHAGHLGGLHSAVVLRVGSDWDRLSLDAQRGLIRATVSRATVVPGGRGAGRITVELFGE